MALVVVLVLTWSTVASTARFGDYSGAKMPQYDTGDHEDNDVETVAEDYHGHAPDASLSLDYKYEEDTKYGKTEGLDKARRVVAWRNPKNRRRDQVESLDDNDADIDDDLDSDVSHRRLSQKYAQRKVNLNSRKYRKEKKHETRRSARLGREKNIRESTESDDYINPDNLEFENNKRKEFDEDEVDRYKETTVRIVRRKPRDRPRMRHFNDDTKEDLMPDRRVISGDLDYTPANEERRRRPTGTRLLEERYRPLVDDDDRALENKQKMKNYDDSEDYYDMKRVESIKNKLPVLLRRTSVKTTESTSSTADTLDVLWTYRRAEGPPPLSTSQGTTTSSTTETSSTAQLTVKTTKAVNSSQELSLAEKSRLSILKKAQRKESLRTGSSTKKPPVLLQVTGKIPTVIMVEPPSSEEMVPRAREFSDDTPERLNRAKLLMRKKLIARAKSIQDLTDNWDEVICDYIDVGLLDGASHKHLSSVNIFLPFLQILLGILM